MKTELKNYICNRFYGISCESIVLMERVIEKCWYQQLEQLPGNCFKIFFSISRNFTKYYLYVKFQMNWMIQTESTEGGTALPRLHQSAKCPACLGLSNVKGQLQRFYKSVSYKRAVKILKHDICITQIGQAFLEILEFKVKFPRKIPKIRNFANVSIIRVEQ